MNYHQRPQQQQTTGSGRIVLIILLVSIALPVLLGGIIGLVVWGQAGFPGLVLTKEQAAQRDWRRVINQSRRSGLDCAASLKKLRSQYGDQFNGEAFRKSLEIKAKFQKGMEEAQRLAEQAERDHGPMPPEMQAELQVAMIEVMQAVASAAYGQEAPRQNFGLPNPPLGLPLPSSNPSPNPNIRSLADIQAENEQRRAREREEQTRRDQERQQREQQRQAQQLADQQAREQRLREFAGQQQPGSLPANTPPANTLPNQDQFDREQRMREARDRDLAAQREAFNRPPANSPPAQFNPGNGGTPSPAASQPPPGFAVTNIDQVKPRDIVLVNTGDKWVEALVQSKRGVVVQVKAMTGEVATVTVDRIRLQAEPSTKPESSLPPALRVAAGSKPSGNKDDEEDDSLFVAKPGGNQPSTSDAAETAVAPTKPATTGKKSTAEYRTWTDDTGTFQVEAELAGFEFDLVQLRRRSDGKLLSLRIEKLSAADQIVVREKFP